MVEKNEVNITTKEIDIPVKYGTVYAKNLAAEIFAGDHEERKDDLIKALQSVKYIYTDYNDIKQNYIRLGFHLRELQYSGVLHMLGYANIEDFAEANLGLDKTAVSRCINVAYKFCKRSNGRLGNPTMFIEDKYKDYSYSQLCEMVSIKDLSLRDKIKPYMTIKEIRELKKNGGTLPAADAPVEDKQKKDSDQHLCITDLTLSGASRMHKMKKAKPIQFTRRIYLIDPDTGRDICIGYYQILMKTDTYIYLRKDKNLTNALIEENKDIIDLDINDAYKVIHSKGNK